MVHGFMPNIEECCRETNCVEFLKENYQLILFDFRGHGKSDKPHDDYYHEQKMTDDVIKLLEHLSIEKANFIGYSMGAYITFLLLLTKPEIIISTILGGFVLTLKNPVTERFIEAFKVENIGQVKDLLARAWRRLAEKGGNDLLALATVLTGLRKGWSSLMTSPAQMRTSLKNIKVPVMTVAGSSEVIPGDKTLVAQLVPDACHFQIQGKTHGSGKSSLIAAPKFHMVVKAFLDLVNDK